MALQTKTLTANGANGYHKFTLTISENSTSTVNNTSALNFSFVLSPIQTSWNWEQWGSSISYTVKINGTTYTGSIPAYDGYSSVTLKSGSLSVGHNSNGSKSINISFSVTDGAGQYYTCGNASSSGTMALTTIPRSSTITSASNITLGNKCGITFTPASASFYYNISFSLGSWTVNTGLFCPGKTTAYTYNSYTIPANETLYKLIPNSPTGTMTATLTTYSSNSTSAKIGSTSSKTFTVTIPNDVRPTIGTITLSPVNINGQNILVQGKNKLTISVSGCSAGLGSSIKSYKFSGPGISTTTTSTSVTTSGTISNAGTLTYTVTVTDNRGRTSAQTTTITCHEYKQPKITSFDVYRCDNDGNLDQNGLYIKCNCNFTYSSVINTNGIDININYKKQSSLDVLTTQKLTIIDGENLYNDFVYNASSQKMEFDNNSTYEMYVTITDDYGGKFSSEKVLVFGQFRILNITKDGTGVAWGKMAEETELFDCKWPIKSDSTITAKELKIKTDNSTFFKVPEIQHGVGKITPSALGTPTYTIITFEKEFSGVPDVVVTSHSHGPGVYVIGVSIAERTKSDVTVYLTRDRDLTTTGFSWIAIY